MKTNIKGGNDERLINTIAKDSKKYQDDINKFELELGELEHKLMVFNFFNIKILVRNFKITQLNSS